MIRRNILATSLVCLVGCSPAANRPAATIGRYETPGEAPVNSWWIATPDGGLVVFDTTRSFTDARAAVAAIKATARPVRAIFITHGHPDHITGIPIYRAAFPAAKVYASSTTQAYMAGKGRALMAMNVSYRGLNDAAASVPPADVVLKDRQHIVVGGLGIDVRLLGPGESPDGTLYSIPSIKTLVAGDVLTRRREPLLAEGRTAAWLNAIVRLGKAYPADDQVLPGHGPQAGLGAAATWQSGYLRRYRSKMSRAAAASSEQGQCVTARETEAVAAVMSREFPTDQPVARMPSGQLAKLNSEGVAWELGGRSCPPFANPMR